MKMQKAVDEIIEIFANGNINISIDPIKESLIQFEKIKELIKAMNKSSAYTT